MRTHDESDAFRQQVEQHARAIFRLAYRMTGNQTDAEDVVQEAFLRAWRQRASFDGRAAFGTWIHKICANCALDHLRARQRRQEAYPVREDNDPVAELPAGSPSPERMAMSTQVSERLGTAMDDLSEMERAAFVLRHYEGMGIEAISEALGVNAGAAKHSIFRAVQKLRAALEPVFVK